MLVRGKSDGEEKISVKRILLLFPCAGSRNKENDKMAFVQNMDCVQPLNGEEESLGLRLYAVGSSRE